MVRYIRTAGFLAQDDFKYGEVSDGMWTHNTSSKERKIEQSKPVELDPAEFVDLGCDMEETDL